MSVAEYRIPLDVAEEIGERLRVMLAPACDIPPASEGVLEPSGAVVVGSVRRRRVDVGDIEIAVLPKFDPASTNLFGDVVDGRPAGYSQLDRVITSMVEADLLVRGDLNGRRLKSFVLGREFGDHAGAKVELYIAAGLDNWGNTLAIRTGPKELGASLLCSWMRYTRHGHPGLMPDYLHHADGLLWFSAPGCRHEVTKCPTERHFWQALKLPCLAMSKRTVEIIDVLRSGKYDVDELEWDE